MTQSPKYKILANVHSGRDLAEPEVTCSVLMNLLATELSVNERLRESFILQEATPVVYKLAELALSDSFCLRIDLPRRAGVPGEWPRVIDSVPELTKGLAQLVVHARGKLLYPFAIWGVKRGLEARTFRAIDAFKLLRWDMGLFDDIVTMGGFRVDVWPSSFDLSISCAELDRGVGWARQALDQPGIIAEWDSF
jgi:hypothetical protein